MFDESLKAKLRGPVGVAVALALSAVAAMCSIPAILLEPSDSTVAVAVAGAGGEAGNGGTAGESAGAGAGGDSGAPGAGGALTSGGSAQDAGNWQTEAGAGAGGTPVDPGPACEYPYRGECLPFAIAEPRPPVITRAASVGSSAELAALLSSAPIVEGIAITVTADLDQQLVVAPIGHCNRDLRIDLGSHSVAGKLWFFMGDRASGCASERILITGGRFADGSQSLWGQAVMMDFRWYSALKTRDIEIRGSSFGGPVSFGGDRILFADTVHVSRVDPDGTTFNASLGSQGPSELYSTDTGELGVSRDVVILRANVTTIGRNGFNRFGSIERLAVLNSRIEVQASTQPADFGEMANSLRLDDRASWLVAKGNTQIGTGTRLYSGENGGPQSANVWLESNTFVFTSNSGLLFGAYPGSAAIRLIDNRVFTDLFPAGSTLLGITGYASQLSEVVTESGTVFAPLASAP